MPDMTEMELTLKPGKSLLVKALPSGWKTGQTGSRRELTVGYLKFQTDYDPKYARAQCSIWELEGRVFQMMRMWCLQNILHFRLDGFACRL